MVNVYNGIIGCWGFKPKNYHLYIVIDFIFSFEYMYMNVKNTPVNGY